MISSNGALSNGYLSCKKLMLVSEACSRLLYRYTDSLTIILHLLQIDGLTLQYGVPLAEAILDEVHEIVHASGFAEHPIWKLVSEQLHSITLVFRLQSRWRMAQIL